MSVPNLSKPRTNQAVSNSTLTFYHPASLVDEKLFDTTCKVYAIATPKTYCNDVRALLKKHVLRLARQSSVVKGCSGESGRKVDDGVDDERGRKRRKVEDGEKLLILLRYLAKPIRGGKENEEESTVGNVGNMIDVEGGTREGVVSMIKSDLRLVTGEDCKEEKKWPKQEEVKKWLLDGLDVIPSSEENRLLEEHEVKVGYASYNMESVLRSLLPKDLVPPASFETAGHIAHVNLREEHTPWKYVIGKVLIDKHTPRIKTVVNKLESTGGPYRTFKMELIAGEDEMVTEVNENSCRFKMNFSKVYWNSRLETEHRRIISSLKPSDILADSFCGIGPFVLPAVKLKRCVAYANDLNPSSIEYLKENAKRNNITLSGYSLEGKDNGSANEPCVYASCGCARDFLKSLILEKGIGVTVVVMNFPSGAPEFLDVFKGLYADRKDSILPLIHCYCFASAENWEEDARRRIRHNLFGGDECDGEMEINVRLVRDVSPKKRQVCASFRLPAQVARGLMT